MIQSAQQKSATTHWPVPNYTVWWQRHVWAACARLLPGSGPEEIRIRDLEYICFIVFTDVVKPYVDCWVNICKDGRGNGLDMGGVLIKMERLYMPFMTEVMCMLYNCPEWYKLNERQLYNTLNPPSPESPVVGLWISRLSGPVELTLRYTTPDIRCRHRRHKCDGGISSVTNEGKKRGTKTHIHLEITKKNWK